MRAQVSVSLMAFALFALPAQATPLARVPGPSVTLAEVMPSAPEEIAGFEIASAPPAGSSRVVTRREIAERLKLQGVDVKSLRLPSAVRIETIAERWTSDELAERTEPVLRASLPPGIQLVRLRATRGAVLPVGTEVHAAKPRFPRRAGRHEVTVMAELMRDDRVIQRLPVSVTLEVSEAALEPTVRRGDRVTLVVRHGNARVGATAQALADADAGDDIWFKVASTGKVVKGRVAAKGQAEVVEP